MFANVSSFLPCNWRGNTIEIYQKKVRGFTVVFNFKIKFEVSQFHHVSLPAAVMATDDAAAEHISGPQQDASYFGSISTKPF